MLSFSNPASPLRGFPATPEEIEEIRADLEKRRAGRKYLPIFPVKAHVRGLQKSRHELPLRSFAFRWAGRVGVLHALGSASWRPCSEVKRPWFLSEGDN